MKQGSELKKEMTAITNLSLELPLKNNIRTTLGQYKKRFEESIDECLNLISSGFFQVKNHMDVLLPKICPKAQSHDYDGKRSGFEGGIGR